MTKMEMDYKMGTLEQIQLSLIDILLQLRRLYFILSLYILIIELLDRNPAANYSRAEELPFCCLFSG